MSVNVFMLEESKLFSFVNTFSSGETEIQSFMHTKIKTPVVITR